MRYLGLGQSPKLCPHQPFSTRQRSELADFSKTFAAPLINRSLDFKSLPLAGDRRRVDTGREEDGAIHRLDRMPFPGVNRFVAEDRFGLDCRSEIGGVDCARAKGRRKFEFAADFLLSESLNLRVHSAQRIGLGRSFLDSFGIGLILTARALSPVELAIANWKGFVAARQSWRRLTELLILLPAREEPMALAAPSAEVLVEAVSLAPPGGRTFVVRDVSFALKAGNGLGIIGPSAAGKSSLARGLVGVWAPVQGTIRLDGAALDQWSGEDLGRHIGYLPQDVELFDGTVAENIARFHAQADPMAIIAAAKQAGVNDLILRLPQGYETRIGEGGMALSAGQRQRIALARALYGDPFLIVLDEPNSNLDHEGEEALTKAILGVRTRGGIVIVVSHRATALASVDLILLMREGKTQAFGPRDEVMAKIVRRSAAPVAPATPLRVVAESGQAS